jgi:hypothetical protein
MLFSEETLILTPDGIYVAVIVTQLSSLMGQHIVNIYDGFSDADSFLIKIGLNTGKYHGLFGIGYSYSCNKPTILSTRGNAVTILQQIMKASVGLCLECILQLGNYDCVMHLVFDMGEK